MRLKKGFMLRNIATQWVAVPVGESTVKFNAMLMLNETGALLWEGLERDEDAQQLANRLVEAYGISEDEAVADVLEFIKVLEAREMLE